MNTKSRLNDFHPLVSPVLTYAFIVLWLGAQILAPFIQMFEIPTFRYRFAKFSWAMFARPPLIYEVDFFRLAPSGRRREIQDLKRYMPWYRNPGLVLRKAEAYYTVEAVQQGTSDLLTKIAETEQQNGFYVAKIHWIHHYRPELPVDWEYKVRS